MTKTNKIIITGIMLLFINLSAFSFDNGFTLGLKANFSGSYTDPHINEKDKNYLGAKFMKGMVGFIMSGDAELTYIFDSKKYFKMENNDIFGGLGWAFNLGLGQGFSGQISGQDIPDANHPSKTIEAHIYTRVYMTPVLNFGTSLKTYLLNNRLVLGFTLGGKVPLDPQPTYELYSNLSDEQLYYLKNKLPKEAQVDLYSETGTLVITEETMKKINPIGCLLKGSIEYNQPVISTMELTIGGYIQYYIYRPKYLTMPKKIQEAAITGGKAKKPKPIDVNFERDQIKSFYLNSLDFGISLGLLFKV